MAIALGGRQVAHKDIQHRGLARTVTTEYDPVLISLNGPVDILEDFPFVSTDGDVFHFENRCCHGKTLESDVGHF